MKRVGVLVLGDEILAGHVHESNSHFVAKRVREMGLRLVRIEVATDDMPDIVASVKRFLFELDLDYVITSGGLGPTPDDRTMEGIAKAIDRPLVTRPDDLAWMHERTRRGHELGYFASPEPNAGLLKMVRLPEGSQSMPNDLGTALGAIVTAGPKPTILFTLPGVPSEFVRMFEQSVVPHLGGGESIHVEELVLYTEESRLFDLLADAEKQFPDVVLGSYPERGRIRLRATGPPERARALAAHLAAATTAYRAPAGRFRDPEK